MTENTLVCVYLGWCSIYDLRTKQIPVWLLRLGMVIGGIYAAVSIVSHEMNWTDAMLGLIPGVIMLLYSLATQGKLGEADGLMAMAVGLFHRWSKCTAELMLGCFLLFGAAAFLLITGKGKRNTCLPFAPFFLIAVVFVWIMEIF